MNLWIRWKYLFSCIGIILLAFVAVSVFDIVIAVLYTRFYSNGAFIISFGVGGVFAAFLGYMLSIQAVPVKNEFARWSLIAVMIIIGLLLFFILSEIEGGDYKMPFKAFGTTLALSSMFFMKGKVEW
jgi:hypothetical protein